MGWDLLQTTLMCALGLLLLAAGVEDARTREIANWKNAAIALMAPLWWWASALPLWPDVAVQIALAAAAFALFAAAFHFGWMGGGDVKLIGALALWLPPGALVAMLVAMSLVGGLLTLVMLVEHKFSKKQGVVEVPYGIAIAIAGLLSLGEPLVNHFA